MGLSLRAAVDGAAANTECSRYWHGALIPVTLLLSLIMALGLLPSAARAAIGDISAENYVGTIRVGDEFEPGKTISAYMYGDGETLSSSAYASFVMPDGSQTDSNLADDYAGNRVTMFEVKDTAYIEKIRKDYNVMAKSDNSSSVYNQFISLPAAEGSYAGVTSWMVTSVAYNNIVFTARTAAYDPAQDISWLHYADTSWYVGHEADPSYTFSTAEQLAGLAKLCINKNLDDYSSRYEILYGHTLRFKGAANASVITVAPEHVLNVCDCRPEANNATVIDDPTDDESKTIPITGGLMHRRRAARTRASTARATAS